MDIHRHLGRGFLEVVYKDAFEQELVDHGIPYDREKRFPIEYKGRILKRQYCADFVVCENVILEVKAQTAIKSEDVKQTINYLACSKLQLGLILNFGESSLVFKRVILS